MTHTAVAISISAALVAVVTGVIALFEEWVPVLSLGVLYVFAVLPVAVVWGLRLALPVSVASMLAFNWFFLPPRHTLTLSDGENWFALAVYLATAVVVSDLAARSRRRAAAAEQRGRESALLATIATDLLAGRELAEEIEDIEDRAAEVLGVSAAEIELGPRRRVEAGRVFYPLEAAGREVGTIFTPAEADPAPDVRKRFLPPLAALLAVASERDQLAREALEAEALRRSDLVKTALLRAVSHDLRSPLTGIVTAVGALRNPTLTLSSSDRDELLETIELESGRLARLVGDLLDLSRLEAGAASPELEAWDLSDLVREAVDTLNATGSGRDRRRDAGRRRGRRPDPAGDRQSGRERDQVLAARTPSCTCASRRRGRRRSFASSTRARGSPTPSSSGSSSRSTGATVIRGPVPVSAWRSRGASSRRTAGGSGRSPGRVRDRPSRSRCRS